MDGRTREESLTVFDKRTGNHDGYLSIAFQLVKEDYRIISVYEWTHCYWHGDMFYVMYDKEIVFMVNKSRLIYVENICSKNHCYRKENVS